MAQKNKSILKNSPIQWEKPYFYHNEERFSPKVDLGGSKAFNTVLLHLEAQGDADLVWHEAIEQAKRVIAEGKWLLWHLDLGLFKELKFPLNNEMQFRSMVVAIEHFVERISPFFSHTLGVVLYQGPADFSDFAWEEGSPRDAAIDYLHHLIDYLPPSVEPFVLLDATRIQEPLVLAQLLYEDDFDHLHFAVKNGCLPHQGLVWKEGELVFNEPSVAEVGICLPAPAFGFHAALNAKLKELNQTKTPYRLILEKNIAAEWDGLEVMYAVREAMEESGRRMLKGFEAAGGLVRFLD